ncbi:hypothetical protein AYL99_02975 [Fonsecaea erecta]|uniref:Prion-inhibition and propagation HeLo domain-containing protein n=1 Tax=Fonsecaea erecta TaxID=1367422 RepID=A0A178ZVD4_9EURO|nr:hypothetical protein AYL99_02975 [Fonsecaea erecta]OAP63748.1 hypothetical protein AYL99_02975 [Fonsecaea erecta]
MAEVAGFVLGGVPILFELLDGAMKAYSFFMRVADADSQYEELRTKLEMEQLRLLTFVDAAELLDDQPDINWPNPVREQQHIMLIAVLKGIESKLDGLAGLTRYEKHKEQAAGQNGGKDESHDDYAELDIAGRYSTLKSKWSGGAKKRAHVRGTNHPRKLYMIGKQAVTNPRVLRWAIHDQGKFENVVRGLREYTVFLENMLQGESVKRLLEGQRRMEVEVIFVRNKVQDLERLQQSMITLTLRSQSQLAAMAGVKLVSLVSSHSDSDLPPDYHSILASKEKIAIQTLVDLEEVPTKDDVVALRRRTSVKYRPGGEGSESMDMWIEWKSFETDWNEEGRPEVTQDSIDRVQGLVALLQQSWQHGSGVFAIPDCLGWFNLHDLHQINPSLHALPNLFGILYRKPSSPASATRSTPTPVSLYAMLHDHPVPSLTVRARLGQQIATSILYLNTVRWFHKSLRSDAIVFQRGHADGSVDFSHPLVTGFEYARPNSTTARSTFVGPASSNALYVHPVYQRQSSEKHRYLRSFDIYSLGIVLLEIAYWMPISAILRAEYDHDGLGKPPSQGFAADVQDILLGHKGKCKTYIHVLNETMGEKYHNAVHGCVAGFVDVESYDENNQALAMKEHLKFMEEVVDSLGGIVV